MFYETYFEESNINQNPLFWFKYKIIMKFEPKNGQVWFLAKCTKTAQKLRKSVALRNLLRREKYQPETIFWSKYKIITKFEPKKGASLVFGKVYENCPKIKKKFYFRKLTSNRVISTKNHLFALNI